MIGLTGQAHTRHAIPLDGTGPGKKAAAIGQQAKQAVTVARGFADLPKNTQGLAASGLARGADPASLFAGLVAPPPTDETAVPDLPADPVTPDPLQKSLSVPVQDAPPAFDGFPKPATGTDIGISAEDDALQLLIGAQSGE